tara:strand:- start:1619 stop:1798 length:180 start_codon:yes stop_codon:yes gene_type:complete
MNECTLKDMKHGRKQAKVIDEAQSSTMKKRMDDMRKIEERNTKPCITDTDYFNQLFKSL